MQKNWNIEKYIDKLSSSDAAPGGGSAAALVSSISSALTSMVFSLTVDKTEYKEYSIDIKNKIDKAFQSVKEANKLFLDFMDKDGEVFLHLMKTFKLPKSTKEEKTLRNEKIQEGYKKALKVPLFLAEKSLKIYDDLLIACKYGNKNLLSDGGVACTLIYSAIESSILNVKINLKGIKDNEYKKVILNKCDEILKQALISKNKIMEIVNLRLGF